MTDGNGDTTPRQITNRNVWDELATLRRETADARHDLADRITRVIGDEAKATRDLIGAIETRVRALETSVANPSPATLGQRVGETEKWQAVMQSAELPSRVDHIEGRLDQMAGAMSLVRALQVVVSLAVGVLTIVGIVLLNQP